MGKLTAIGVLVVFLMSQALLGCCRKMDGPAIEDHPRPPVPPAQRNTNRGRQNVDYHSFLGLPGNMGQIMAKARELFTPEDLKVYSNVIETGVRTLIDNMDQSSNDDQSFSRTLEKEQDTEALASALKDFTRPERMRKFREAYETAMRVAYDTGGKLNLTMESPGVFRDIIDPSTESRIKGLIKKATQTFARSDLSQNLFNPMKFVQDFLATGQQSFDLRDLLQPQNQETQDYEQSEDDREKEYTDLEESVPNKRSKSQNVGDLAIAATKALFDNSFKKINKKRNVREIADGADEDKINNPEERSLQKHEKEIHASDDMLDVSARAASDSANTKDFLGEMQSSIRALVDKNNVIGQNQNLLSSVRELFQQPSGVDEIVDTASRLLEPKNNLKTNSDPASSPFWALTEKLRQTVAGDPNLDSSARELPLSGSSFKELGEMVNAAIKTLSNDRNDNNAAASSSKTLSQPDALQDMAALTNSVVRSITNFNNAIGNKNDLTSETRDLLQPNDIEKYGNMVNSAAKLVADVNDRFKDQANTNVMKSDNLQSKEPLDILRLLDTDTGNSEALNQLRNLITKDLKSENHRIEAPRDQSGLATYEELIQEGYILCKARKTVNGAVESFPLKLAGLDKVIMNMQLPIPNPEAFDVLGLTRTLSNFMKTAQDEINEIIKTQAAASTTVKPNLGRSLLDLFNRQETPPPPPSANHMLLTVNQALNFTKYPCQLLDLAQSFLLNSTIGQFFDMKDWRLPVSDFTHSLNPMEIFYLRPLYDSIKNIFKPLGLSPAVAPTTTTTTTTTAKPAPNFLNEIGKLFQG